MKKLISLFLALAMILMVGAAFATEGGAGEGEGEGGSSALAAGTIAITSPSGIAATDEVTYLVYKVFDATSNGTSDAISYQLVSGKTTTPNANFTVDTAGNVSGPESLSATDITDIAAYVANDEPVATITVTGPGEVGTANVGYGYFYITTTTGSLVTIDSTNPVGEVNDKNTVPELDKTITGASDITDEGKKALAQIGTDVEYTVAITVGKGSTNLVFHDKMENGLAFKGNDSVTVTGVETSQYTIKEEPDPDDDLTITFADGIAENTVITIKYKATITTDALTALENDAYLTFGHDYETTHETTETYNAQIAVQKYDGAKSANKPLKGSGFKLKNADGKYYKFVNGAVTWVDAEADGDEHVSGDDGKVAPFNGLANGKYTLVETTVPGGYNKAADTEVTIASDDYTDENLNQVAAVENNSGTELPSTGGIGTTIFYVVGGLLLVGAAIVLVARRKANN